MSMPMVVRPKRIDTRQDCATFALMHLIAPLLKTGDPAATPDRCFQSKHVKDLRFIVFVALLAVFAAFFVGMALAYESATNDLVKAAFDISKPASDGADKAVSDDAKQQVAQQARHHRPFAAASNFLTFFGPVAAAFGVIAAWAYQVAGTRLGVVDLFACEISTLCRVSTVLDTVPHMIDRLETPAQEPDPGGQGGATAGSGAQAAPEGSAFKSEENYFPVFENNTKDLQSLEARVVINITAFYTYMKATRDAMRAIATIGASDRARRHEAMRNLVYLLYLGFESGRKAIHDLVEFDPERAERTVVVLMSELAAYRFLLQEFGNKDDMRYKRLRLREPDYADVIPDLIQDIETGYHGDKPWEWEPACLLVPDLQRRYQDVLDTAKKVA